MDIPETDLTKYLKAYKLRNQTSIRENVPFENTVLRKF